MTHRQLYGLAALLWLIAGVNVLRIGLVNWPSETNILVSILWLIGSLAFFAGFIFPRVVKRNLTHRPWTASRRYPALAPVLHALLVDHHGGHDHPRHHPAHP